MSSPIWPIQGSPEFIALFGNPDTNGDGAPDPSWVTKHLTTIVPPYQMFYGNAKISRITVNTACAGALARALQGILTHYGSQAAIQKVGMHRFSGCYNFRVKRGSRKLSMHAYAAAIDMDAGHNAMGKPGGSMPAAVVGIFKDQGAAWGGGWTGKSHDPMHFQFARLK